MVNRRRRSRGVVGHEDDGEDSGAWNMALVGVRIQVVESLWRGWRYNGMSTADNEARRSGYRVASASCLLHVDSNRRTV